MKLFFEKQGEYIGVRKIPKENLIEVRYGVKKILYERTADGPVNLSEEHPPHEAAIMEFIKRHFMYTKYNRHKHTWSDIRRGMSGQDAHSSDYHESADNV